MKLSYRIYIKNLTNSLDAIKYRKLLQTEWNNNVYYSIEHLTHFENKLDTLKSFVFEKNGIPIILMPFVFRKIIINDEEYPYYDVISPYGYCGPLFNDTVSKEDLVVFWEQVDSWYRDNNVIAEFIRFSLDKNYLAYSGNLVNTLFNVRGQLLENFDEQWAVFLPKVRNNYRKAINYNLKFKIYHKNEITKNIVAIFNDIYTNTMSRNNAASIYFFSSTYFENLILSNLENFSIAIVYYKDIPISIELIINYESTIYAFLGGTNAEYFSYRPNDFLRVQIIDWAIKNQIKYYVLGGGMKNGDGLYKNKKSLFPKDQDVIFYTGRKIIDQKIYNALSLSVDKEYMNIEKEDLNNYFFPFYRLSNT